jgi:uncharacterized pyridoxamine 5'-phosphate oxidase family protein
MTSIFLFVLLLALFSACEKPIQPKIEPVTPTDKGGMFILNEGNYTQANASLGFYDYSKNELYNNVFTSANNRPLGDVLQSMNVYNDKAFLVLNNSNKIEVININTFKSIATITGLTSPRYCAFVPPNKCYVTDLYENAVSIVDLNTYKVSGKINLPASTEGVISFDNKLYICQSNNKSVFIVNTNTDKVIDTLILSYGPNSMVIDKNNKLWIVCSGSKDKNEKAGIYRINPYNDSIEFGYNSYSVSGIFGARQLLINGAKNYIYWLNSGIYRMAIDALTAPQNMLIEQGSYNFYGFGVDPGSGDIYVSDAKNFDANSVIVRYDEVGNYKGTFMGEKITNGFYFYYK